jgi:cobaltochelatase CobT
MDSHKALSVFEGSLGSIARVLARQYNIKLKYVVGELSTDGKEIILPAMSDISPASKAILNGLLDSMTAQCKFTNFNEIAKINQQYHRQFNDLVEKVRVERNMSNEFPGCKANLDHINGQLEQQLAKERGIMPWPIRLALAARQKMLGQTPQVDGDFQKQWDDIQPELGKLNSCHSTEEVRELTYKIVRKIIQSHEQQQQQKPGPGQPGEGAWQKKEVEGKLLYAKLADSQKQQGNLDEGPCIDITQMAKDQLLAEEKKRPGGHDCPPLSTEMDIPKDYSNKGNKEAYARLKHSVMPTIRPIQQALERSLFIHEDRKFITEKTRGRINTRALARFCTDKDYRTPFQQFSKKEVNEVAVAMMIDCSGSMAGAEIELAKKAAVALGESLKALGISFEVTGFTTGDSTTYYSQSLVQKAKRRGLLKTGMRRYPLDLRIFKSFDKQELNGITYASGDGGTPEADSFEWACARLLARPQPRKVFITLCDGSSDNPEKLKHKIALATKVGVEVIGIGIQTDHVQHTYPDFLVINDVEELPVQIMKKMTKVLLKGLESGRF